MPRETFVPLPVPVPPMLERALDYSSEARLVAFYWSSLGDEAMYHDGLHSGVGDWMAYLAFVRHPTVEPYLRPFDLGSSEDEARHWLVLDRKARALSVLPARGAAALLAQQWGTRPDIPLRLEALDPVPQVLAAVTGKEGWRVVWLDGAPLGQQGPEQTTQLAELRAWLDQQEGGVTG